MSYEHKPNKGSLFKNDKREKDSQPHATGSALIDGVEYWVSAWTNFNEKSGVRYQALSFTPKEEKQESRQEPRQASQANQFINDDIPF